MNELDEETVRIHLHLFKRDVERINAIRGKARFNTVVRSMIRTVLNNLDAKVAAEAAPIKIEEEDLLND